jgi:PGF-pre-PGF domain-containing protein
MNRKKLSLIVLTVLLIAGIAGAQDQMPINPAPGYYGSVTVNGQPASIGTTIIAMIGGEVRGYITTSVSGFFGDNPGRSKLWVRGFQNETGSTVTFFFNNVAAQQTAQLTGAGTVNRVDLDFEVPGPGENSGGGTGGGGSGGGGVTSAEPLENIELYETRDADLVAGIPVSFRFTSPQLAVYELVITANVSAGLTSAKVEQLKGTSRLVTSPPSGTIYKNMNVWLGSSGFAVPTNIREGTIRFRVDNNWLSSENIDASTISMMRWDGSQWISLETKQASKDDKFAYYEANSNSFSPFAISGVKTASMKTQVTATPDVSPTAAPLTIVPKTSLNWILYLIVAIIIIAAVYSYSKRK